MDFASFMQITTAANEPMCRILLYVYNFSLTNHANVAIHGNKVNKQANIDGSVHFPFKRFDSIIVNSIDSSLRHLC